MDPHCLSGALERARFPSDALVELKSRFERRCCRLLSAAVRARISILISGGTGAGKTTLLNVLSHYIPETERLVTIEDAAELQLAAGECRAAGNQAAQRGRQGSDPAAGASDQQSPHAPGPHHHRRGPRRRSIRYAAGHEYRPRGLDDDRPRQHPARCHRRLESMVAMGNTNLPEEAVRQQIASAITIVVQGSRLSDGTRKVMNVSEITGMDENVISMHDIFSFVKKGIGPNGNVLGVFRPTGIRPKFLERLRVSGILLPSELFESSMEVS